MAKIKNKLRQPLVLNAKEEAVHFLAKETKEVSDELLQEVEFKSHIDKGNLVVIQLG